MDGVMAAAAERAGIPEDVVRELVERVRRQERETVTRHLAGRLHEATMYRLSSTELAKLGEKTEPRICG